MLKLVGVGERRSDTVVYEVFEILWTGKRGRCCRFSPPGHQIAASNARSRPVVLEHFLCKLFWAEVG
jgi:hypothetical protein